MATTPILTMVILAGLEYLSEYRITSFTPVTTTPSLTKSLKIIPLDVISTHFLSLIFNYSNKKILN